MKTITIPGFIYASQPENWQFGDKNIVEGVAYRFSLYELSKASKVCPCELTFDLPEGFNPAEGFIKNLQAEKKEATADFQARITEINRQISQLQAIEYTPGVAA